MPLSKRNLCNINNFYSPIFSVARWWALGIIKLFDLGTLHTLDFSISGKTHGLVAWTEGYSSPSEKILHF